VFGSKESLAAHMNYTPALTDLMAKFQQSGGKADIDSVTKWLGDNGYLKEKPKGKTGRRERLAKLFEEPKVEVAPTEEAGVEATPEMTPEEVRINMKPITDEMAGIEMEFTNNGYSIDWDYDNEIIITDKNGEIVDAEELPAKLLPLAAQYEKATSGLAGYDFDSYRKALDQSRKDVGGIETEFEEVKPLAITEKATEKALAKPFEAVLWHEGYGEKTKGDAVYLESEEASKAASGKGKPYRVKLNNPYIVEKDGDFDLIKGFINEFTKNNPQSKWHPDTTKYVNDKLRRLGYDGLVIKQSAIDTDKGYEDIESTYGNAQVVAFNKNSVSPAKQIEDGKGGIVYHGGDITDLNSIRENEPLFVTESESEAIAYSKGNGGDVSVSKIDLSKIGDEKVARDILKKMGYSEEYMLHELIDPRFDESYIGDNDVKKLYSEIKKQGYIGISFMDTGIAKKKNVTNIFLVSPKETLAKSGFETNKIVNESRSFDLLEQGYLPVINGKVIQNPTEEELNNYFSKNEYLNMVKPSPAEQIEAEKPKSKLDEKKALDQSVNELINKKNRYNKIAKKRKPLAGNLLNEIKEEADRLGFATSPALGGNIKLVSKKDGKAVSRRNVDRKFNKERNEKVKAAKAMANDFTFGLRGSILLYFLNGGKISTTSSELGRDSKELQAAKKAGIVSDTGTSASSIAKEDLREMGAAVFDELDTVAQIQDVVASFENKEQMEDELVDMLDKFNRDMEEAAEYDSMRKVNQGIEEGRIDEGEQVDYFELLPEDEKIKLIEEYERFKQEVDLGQLDQQGEGIPSDVAPSQQEETARESKSKRLQRAEELRAKAQDLRDASGGTLMAGPKLLAAAYEAYATILETTENIIEAIKKFKGTKEYKDLDVNGKKELDVVLATDAVEEEISSGRDPQEAVDDLIGSQEWYQSLSANQKEQLDEILKDDFGVTPVTKTGIKATIANIIDNYYKGDRQSKLDNKRILESDPKLKYIYDNISKINKQLQDAGVITDKTDGCP
jgi:hypothetical protein